MVFRFSFAALLAATLATSCGGTQLRPWDLGDGERSQLTCMDSGRDVLGLAPTQRAKLDQIAESGIVAVRFTEKGCNVELELLDCFAEGKYQYKAYSSEDHKTAYRAGDLWAQLPLGAARLGAGLHEGDALKKDVLMVGTRLLPPDAPIGTLRGRECAKANYVVKSITVGGFAIHRGSREAIDASASLFGIGAGTQLAQGIQRHDGDGSLEACVAANRTGQASAQCSAPLKIELMSIEGRQAEAPPPPRPEPVVEVPRPAPVPTPAPAPAAVEPPRPRAPSPASGGMVSIPGGSFLMGANDLTDDEKPPHRVTVGAFEIDLTEVTVAAYRACVDAGRCTDVFAYTIFNEAPTTSAGCNWDKPDRGNHPINCVDWNQATAYCAFANKRLPTEREWEFVARGPKGSKYPWGDEAPGSQLCWSGGGLRQSTCPVGSYREGASPFGVLDMAGNVWEWTSSAYCGPESTSCAGAARVSRGGNWLTATPARVRGASRHWIGPSTHDDNVGFRCAR